MRFTWFALLLMVFLGTRAWGQAQPRSESTLRRYEIYGGSAFSGGNPSGDSFGGGFGFSGNFTRWAGALGEFTILQHTCCVVNSITLTDYLLGPRIAKRLSASSRVTPFADVLFGGQTLLNSSNHHSWEFNNGSGPAIAGDGGADISVTSRLALRGEFGFIHSRFSRLGASAVSNDRWRAGTYIVYRF